MENDSFRQDERTFSARSDTDMSQDVPFDAPPPGRKPATYFILHRYGIVLFNCLLLLILASSLFDMAIMIKDPANDVDEMERTLEGVAAIYVAYGVLLEERESLLKIFRYYPRFASGQEGRTDHVCHDYGVLFLVIGLLVEVATGLVKIPDRIVNTASLETALFAAGVALLAAGGDYTVRFCGKLLTIGEADAPQRAA
jgi:hypothetical protein